MTPFRLKQSLQQKARSHSRISAGASEMERSIILLLLCAAAAGQIRQHVFIPTPMTWSDARAHCRQHYTDLSFVVSQSDQEQLIEAAGDSCPKGRIGLHRHPGTATGWMWSGGADVTYQNWAYGQPDHSGKHVALVKYNGRWETGAENDTLPFYCTVTRRMLWEEALDFCRSQESDLPSLLSEAELRQSQAMIQPVSAAEPVWIGLRYLNGWMWVNGRPLVYNAWPPGDREHACPGPKRCGALNKTEGWRNWDCKDRLNFICI
ncbi:macrophage mannose receptor 1-like [Betta splendens]|uniref:Macrophage mannose receptor 1-like n=1 Tax=Betta splendens TaxID=158456 RepID=A0A6P7N5J9_BETSP|nr:macrophage mannose receptor 1-like [Betta splendens]